MLFIQQVLDQVAVAKVDGQDDMLGEVEQTDMPLGTLPEELQRLYVFMKDFCASEKAKLSAIQAKVKQDLSKLDELAVALSSHQTRINYVRRIFHNEILLAFPGAVVADYVNIRKGWQVVSSPLPSKKAEE